MYKIEGEPLISSLIMKYSERICIYMYSKWITFKLYNIHINFYLMRYILLQNTNTFSKFELKMCHIIYNYRLNN